tara:strand:+ start:3621 stop:4193 length:573 start_codon:yes stop_codon:yes gene_type:complete
MKTPPTRLPRATELAHSLIRERISTGDSAIDATTGNGHDTLFLADCVGPTGAVVGFDIQKQAIEKTRARTVSLPQVSLHLAGHEKMAEFVQTQVTAVTFNLGYLPSGDKSIITSADSTIKALNESLQLLSHNGIVTIILYTGHEGGAEEGEAVSRWANSLDQDKFTAIRYQFENQRNSPPFLIAVEHRRP